MLIMQKVVYHLADIERTTENGLPRDEVKAWYLEGIEEELSSTEELEAETILIEKVLTKLVKVSSLPFLHFMRQSADFLFVIG